MRLLDAIIACVSFSAAFGSIMPRGEHPARMAALHERALSRLPKTVADELRARDPSTYELPLDSAMDEESALVKRQDSNVYSKCQGDAFAATYDDGIYKYHQNFTDLWSRAGHKITFFINLQNYDCDYDDPYAGYGKYSVDKGMTICSHTAHHKDLKTLTRAQIDAEIEQVETFTWKVLGLVPNCFRPPFESTTPEINEYLKTKHGLDIILQDVDSQDWQVVDNDPEKSIANWNNIKGGGHMVLNHETHLNSLTMVAPAAIKHLDSQNIKSVGLAKCLGKTTSYKAFDKTKRTARDSTWKCPPQ